jgi:hypothetical protein
MDAGTLGNSPFSTMSLATSPPLSTLVGDTDLEQSDSGGELTIVGMARPGPGDVGLTTKGSEGGGVAVSGREVESCDWAMTTGTDGG